MQWPEFFVLKPFLLPLKAGKHTLRLENVGGCGVKLKRILTAAPFLPVTVETKTK